MFPCSLRYFANVPLFPKAPGIPSILTFSPQIVTQKHRKETLERKEVRTPVFIVSVYVFSYYQKQGKDRLPPLQNETSMVQYL